ncbi:hypothetical protein BDV97DRAFT_63619 [Delphinella strobiligena]|nr:hypothetical protein BDV97DRAFT_63619 [Delphinella strobiligena]
MSIWLLYQILFFSSQQGCDLFEVKQTTLMINLRPSFLVKAYPYQHRTGSRPQNSVGRQKPGEGSGQVTFNFTASNAQ